MPSFRPFVLCQILAVSVLSSGFVQTSLAQETPKRLIVQYRNSNSAQVSMVKPRMAEQELQVKSASLVSVASAPSELNSVISELQKDPNVLYVEEDVERYPSQVSNDPKASSQWNLMVPSAAAVGAVNAISAWKRSTGKGVVVAVLDTGITPHPDLQGRLLPGYDFVSDASRSNDGDGWDADPADPGDFTSNYGSSWHGTAVSGVIAANSNNGIGIAGLAPEAMILPVRVMGAGGGLISDIATGIRWAAGIAVPGVPDNPNPAKVINMSLSSTGSCFLTEQYAIDEALALGVVVVVAAGNFSQPALGAPSNCKGVLSVTAATQEGDIATYSNRGANASVSAPGGGFNQTLQSGGIGIWTTTNTGTKSPLAHSLATYMGTSFAAPHVAAAVALLFAAKPKLTPAEIEVLIKSSARPFAGNTLCASSKVCGVGLLDANAALTKAGVPSQGGDAAPVAPLAPDSTKTETKKDEGGGGGGGCTVGKDSKDFSLMFLMLLAALVLWLFKKRK